MIAFLRSLGDAFNSSRMRGIAGAPIKANIITPHGKRTALGLNREEYDEEFSLSMERNASMIVVIMRRMIRINSIWLVILRPYTIIGAAMMKNRSPHIIGSNVFVMVYSAAPIPIRYALNAP